MKPSILLIEDDQELCLELAAYLRGAGFSVRCASTLAVAQRLLAEQPPELLVVDINLPDGSGLELCWQIDRQRIGIVVCTARDERELRIASLNDFVDAYLVKPVDPEELDATLTSVHRRVAAARSTPHILPPVLGLTRARERPWRLDLDGRLLIAPTGAVVLLTAAEYALLATLMRNSQRFATREELIAGTDTCQDARSAHRLEALISRLRRKVSDKCGLKLPLLSAYGRGYQLAAPTQWVDPSPPQTLDAADTD